MVVYDSSCGYLPFQRWLLGKRQQIKEWMNAPTELLMLEFQTLVWLGKGEVPLRSVNIFHVHFPDWWYPHLYVHLDSLLTCCPCPRSGGGSRCVHSSLGHPHFPSSAGAPFLEPWFPAWKWVTQSCLTLCNPMDYTVHGILKARILE